MEILNGIWTFFANEIFRQPAYVIGLIVFIGYLLLGKKLYDVIGGTLKAIIGVFILSVGTGQLVVNFRPILIGLKEKFKLSAMVIDPYFGDPAVQSIIKEQTDAFAAAGKQIGISLSLVIYVMLIALVVNLLLVKFSRWTKIRSVFTTGHVQYQQAGIALVLIFTAFPQLQQVHYLIIMSVVLGLYWAVGSNLTVDITQELTEGGGFCVAHQQMFGIKFFSILSEKLFGKNKKRLEDIKLPGFLSMFNENMVSTAILMLIFFSILMGLLGKQYFVDLKLLGKAASFPVFVFNKAIHFAVYVAILQLGVRTFVSELTNSFQGISNKLLPGAVPGIDCAAVYGFGSQNAVTLGFLAGALGQAVAIIILILTKSPILVIAGFVPVFFDNATIAVFANNKGGVKAALLMPFLAGLCQVFGSALIGSVAVNGLGGFAAHGGYIGMWDWAVLWNFFAYLMRNFGWIGLGLIVIALIAIPQIQYAKNKDTYFLITEDYDAYVELKQKKENK